jgi:hypothetical protein
MVKLVSLCLLLGMAGSAAAETLTSPACGVTVDMPQGWKKDAMKTGLLIAMAPGAEAVMLMKCADAGKIEDIVKNVDKDLGVIVKDVKLGKAKDFEVHGLKGFVVEASAVSKDDGKPFSVATAIVVTKNKHVLVVGAAFNTAKKDTFGPPMLQMIGSITPK